MSMRWELDLRTYVGWARPVNAHRVHYFDGKGLSACENRFIAPQGTAIDIPANERCKVCIRKLADAATKEFPRSFALCDGINRVTTVGLIDPEKMTLDDDGKTWSNTSELNLIFVATVGNVSRLELVMYSDEDGVHEVQRHPVPHLSFSYAVITDGFAFHPHSLFVRR